jgi:hypothetical protein
MKRNRAADCRGMPHYQPLKCSRMIMSWSKSPKPRPKMFIPPGFAGLLVDADAHTDGVVLGQIKVVEGRGRSAAVLPLPPACITGCD